jgi:biotin operon repressor
LCVKECPELKEKLEMIDPQVAERIEALKLSGITFSTKSKNFIWMFKNLKNLKLLG